MFDNQEDRVTVTTIAPESRRFELSGERTITALADLLSVIYIGVIATVASVTGAFYVMFPELGALSWDVMRQPSGRWASSPLLLAISPPLTGLVGTIVTRTMPYGFASVLIVVIASMAILRWLRSPVAPAISAGLLPLVLDITSWWYPVGIVFGSALLALISRPWRRYLLSLPSVLEHAETTHDVNKVADSNEIPDALPRGTIRSLAVPVLGFVAIAVVMVELTGLRFILFPPLVVIVYEMFLHREHCPWVARPFGLPLACLLSAAGGWFLRVHIPSDSLAAMLSVGWGIGVLRLLDIHVPPVNAVALLPMVMTNPTIDYPIAVGTGTALASLWFVGMSKLEGHWMAKSAFDPPPSSSR